MNELLNQLNDITLPDGIAFSLADGWYVIFALLLFVVAAALYYMLKWRNKPRILAAREFTRIKQNFVKHQNSLTLAKECNQLIRRLMQYQHKNALHSEQTFIEQLSKWHKPSDDILRVFTDTIYQKQQNVAINEKSLLDYCQRVIKEC